MQIQLENGWLGNSMKDGGCFPITFLEFYVDLHPSSKYFSFCLLNFCIWGHFRKKRGSDGLVLYLGKE